MKKKVILAIAVASLMMSACSTSQSATVDKTEDNNKQTSLTQKTVNEETLAVDTDSSIQREFAYELTSMGDYNKLAMDFNELVNDADMILKIKVESVTPYINENGMIQSEIVPVVEEVYKGKYNGEKLYVNGGEMLYDDFIQKIEADYAEIQTVVDFIRKTAIINSEIAFYISPLHSLLLLLTSNMGA